MSPAEHVAPSTHPPTHPSAIHLLSICSSIHPLILCPSIYSPSIHLSIYHFSIHLSIHPSIHPLILYPSIYPLSIHPPILHLSSHSHTYPLIHLSTDPLSIHPPSYPLCIHPYLFIHPSIHLHPSIHPLSIHPLTHPLIFYPPTLPPTYPLSIHPAVSLSIHPWDPTFSDTCPWAGVGPAASESMGELSKMWGFWAPPQLESLDQWLSMYKGVPVLLRCSWRPEKHLWWASCLLLSLYQSVVCVGSRKIIQKYTSDPGHVFVQSSQYLAQPPPRLLIDSKPLAHTCPQPGRATSFLKGAQPTPMPPTSPHSAFRPPAWLVSAQLWGFTFQNPVPSSYPWLPFCGHPLPDQCPLPSAVGTERLCWT